MVITGEVGTGKTTLCRSFLDQLDDTTHVAYIFNPKMDARQLLQTVNDELVHMTADKIDLVEGIECDRKIIDLIVRIKFG